MGRRNQVCRSFPGGDDRGGGASPGGRTVREVKAWTGTGAPGHDARLPHGCPSAVPQPPNSGPNRNNPCSVPIQNLPPESTDSARARLTHPTPAHGAGGKCSCHVRPPSGECPIPLSVLIHMFGLVSATMASTYWL